MSTATPGTALTTRLVDRPPAIYDQATDPAAFIREIGEAIHRSGIFGTETPSQGHVLALECAARRIPPLSLAERYHMIKGKLSMKADAMLGEFHQIGGRHRIVRRTPEWASIELTLAGQTEKFSCSWKDAQEEPFVYMGKEADVIAKMEAGKPPAIKPKYATPRSRMQMLWARVVSDGVRAMAPGILSGHYTPEEITDYMGVDLPPEPDGSDSSDGSGTEEDADVVDVDHTEIVTEPTPAPSVVQDSQPTVNPKEAWDSIDAKKAAETKAAIDQRLKEKAAEDARLAESDRKAKAEGEEMRQAIAVAEAKSKATKAMEEKLMAEGIQGSASHPAKDGSAIEPEAPDAGTATPEQVQEAKELFAYLQPPKEKIVAMLARMDAKKVSDLSRAHCNAMLGALRKEKARREAAGNAGGTSGN